MKKCVLFFLILLTNVYAFSDEIVQEFFDIIEHTEIPGGFWGCYLVLPEDNIPYSQIQIFNKKELGFKYYSYSLRSNDAVTGSIVEIYNQQFSVDIDIMWSTGNLWSLEYAGQKYLCFITNQFGSYSQTALLFNITDKKQVKLIVWDYVDVYYNYYPKIGVYPRDNGKLCTIATQYEESKGEHVILYSIEEDHLEEVLDKNGRNIGLFFTWYKRDSYFEITERNIP